MINVFLLGARAPLQVRSLLLMAYYVCFKTLFKNKMLSSKKIPQLVYEIIRGR
jgi:hypothetical protein